MSRFVKANWKIILEMVILVAGFSASYATLRADVATNARDIDKCEKRVSGIDEKLDIIIDDLGQVKGFLRSK